MIRAIVITATLVATTFPALAQFPPPGIYTCMTAEEPNFGILTLFVAGDYDFVSEVSPSGTGQVASSGPSVNALTGPLADIHLKGSFATDDRGEAVFIFESDIGTIQCALPPL